MVTQTFKFTLAHAVAVNGYIKREVDSDYDLSNSYFMVTGFIFSKGSNFFLLKALSQLNAGAVLEIKIGNVKNPPYGQITSNYLITTQYTDGNTIDQATIAGTVITAGVLSSASVRAVGNNYVAGEKVSYSVSFTTVNAVDVNGKVVIGFDAGYNLSGVLSNDVAGNAGSSSAGGAMTIVGGAGDPAGNNAG